jgi:hypothetical protein
MARAAAKYLFAALLALLSTQAVEPSVRVVAAVEIVCRSEAEQQTPSDFRRTRADLPTRRPEPSYISQANPEPAAAFLFQRPPPSPSLFS